MDINHGDRRRRWLLRRIIGCLLLVVFWYVDGAPREAAAAWRQINKISTYIGGVSISKDIVILNHKEQNTCTMGSRNDLIKIRLIYHAYSASFFPWPICCGAEAGIMSTLGDNVIYGVLQIHIKDEDGCVVIPITTHTRTYGWSKPIVLISIADNVIRFKYVVAASGPLTVFGTRAPFETIENRADIGAELHVLRTSGNNRLGNPNDQYYTGDYRIESNKSDRPYLTIGLMFVACGLLLVLSNILVTKAVKRSYDPVYLCLAWLGGFVSIAVPTLWVIWH